MKYITLLIMLLMIGCNRQPIQKKRPSPAPKVQEAPVLKEEVRQFIQRPMTKKNQFIEPPPIKFDLSPKLPPPPLKEFDLTPKNQEPKIISRPKPKPKQAEPKELKDPLNKSREPSKPPKKSLDSPIPVQTPSPIPILDTIYFAKLIVKGPPNTNFFILHPSGSSWIQYKLDSNGQKELGIRKDGLIPTNRYFYHLKGENAGIFRKAEFGQGQTVIVTLN